MSERQKFILTAEGKLYAKSGLPEKNLVAFLKNNHNVDIRAARSIPNFAVAFQWAKKNGWVDIKNGRLVLLKEPGSIPEQSALERLEMGISPEKEMLSVLIKRKLAEPEKEDSYKRAEKLVGQEITNLNEDLIKTGLWREVRLRPYNVEAAGKKPFIGKRQPYSLFLSEVRQKLVELGFKEMTGPIIEMEFWNFDALYQAQNHPSRDWTQTYSLKNPKKGELPDKDIVERVKASHENGWKTGSTGWGYKWDPEKAAKLMPRAHDTAISPRVLSSKELEIPGKCFQMVRCFRPDVIDATHGVEFNQLGGFVVGDLSFRNLLGLLKTFIEEITGFKEVRFKPDYFPFTEPSCEVSAKHPELGWIELAGAGIFRPELTEPLGIKEPVIAWGFGIDRLAMMRLNIKDIRYLFSRNLDWLRTSRIG